MSIRLPKMYRPVWITIEGSSWSCEGSEPLERGHVIIMKVMIVDKAGDKWWSACGEQYRDAVSFYLDGPCRDLNVEWAVRSRYFRRESDWLFESCKHNRPKIKETKARRENEANWV